MIFWLMNTQHRIVTYETIEAQRRQVRGGRSGLLPRRPHPLRRVMRQAAKRTQREREHAE